MQLPKIAMSLLAMACVTTAVAIQGPAGMPTFLLISNF